MLRSSVLGERNWREALRAAPEAAAADAYTAQRASDMTTGKPRRDSAWSLSLDLWSAKVLIWLASVGRDAELTPEAHRFLFDRYQRLARCQEARGRRAKARRLQAKADQHYIPGRDDGPPYAAAVAMPRPRPSVWTDAVARRRLDPPDDAA
jgi:hypothetical protein